MSNILHSIPFYVQLRVHT